MRTILIFMGFLFSLINLLPMPWRLRLLWFRWVFFLTDRGTRIFPMILEWTIKQNIAYKMGKQEGAEYESIVQLEEVLEYLDRNGYSVRQLKHAILEADVQSITPDQYGNFIARKMFLPSEAKRQLLESRSTTRY